MVKRSGFSVIVVSMLLGGLLLSGCAKPAPVAPPAPAVKPAPEPKAGTGPLAASPAAKPSQLPRSLIFGSMPIGTSTYIVNTGLATVVQKYTGIKAIVQPMASTPLIYNELDAGRVDITLSNQGNSFLAFRGEGEFKQAGPRRMRRLGSGYAAGYLWVTRPDTGIKTIPDMVGKKAAYISAVSPPTTDLFRLSLETYGIVDKVTAMNRSTMAAAATALIEKKVDVIGGPYGAFGYEIAEAARGIVAIPLGADVVKYVQQKRPELAIVLGKYPAGYFGLPQEVATASAAMDMTVSPNMPDETAYAIVKAIYDHPEDTKAIHADVGDYNLEKALAFGFFIPTHPGAIKYFTEKGKWTKEHDELQKKFLAEEEHLAAQRKK